MWRNLTRGFKLGAQNSFVWFTLLGFLRPAINVFLLPLYLLKLTPEDYGIMALALSSASLIAIIASMRLDSACRTYYFDYSHDISLLKVYISNIFRISLLVVIVVWSVLYGLGDPLFNLVFVSSEMSYHPYGCIALGTALSYVCTSIFYTYLRNAQLLKPYVWFTLITVLLTVLLQSYFVLVLDLKVMGILLGALIPNLIVLVGMILTHAWLVISRFDWKIVSPSLRFGFALIPLSFLLVFERQMDKIILERFQSLELVGIYAIVITFISMNGILLSALDNSIRPILYPILKKSTIDKSVSIGHYQLVYLIVGFICMSGIIMIGCNLDLFTSNPKYLQAKAYFIWIGLAFVPSFFSRYFNLLLLFDKRSSALTNGTIVRVLVMLALMLVLVGRYSIYGIIAAIAVGELCNMIVYAWALKGNSNSAGIRNGALMAIGYVLTCLLLFALLKDRLQVFGIVQFVVISLFIIAWQHKRLIKFLKETSVSN